ncbi:MAG: nucleotidyltransferase domain-containing protein [Candidatus Syntrophonatronum acetioxidans]|uniref:Nucleotidyltransferase domain-containing protein n=1 Tax=Candidatus Syntrophonatronum acetioxidans TaxID=1795816 RepID=A0A424YCG8_9FIRM|nr:MAG: nucleotidyltransferase domain-containing protein [Candidatus Syntrophonatronum acetioxidans]
MSKTADQLSPEELEHFRKALIKRVKEKNGELAKRYSKAKEIAEKIAQELYNNFDAKEVILFGSAAKGEYFNKWSDIDLAAVGIPDHRFYAAVAFVTGYSDEFKIDLVDPDECSSGMKKSIFEEGIRL